METYRDLENIHIITMTMMTIARRITPTRIPITIQIGNCVFTTETDESNTRVIDK